MQCSSYALPQPLWVLWGYEFVGKGQVPRRRMLFVNEIPVKSMEHEFAIRAKGVDFDTAFAALGRYHTEVLLLVPVNDIWFIPKGALASTEEETERWKAFGEALRSQQTRPSPSHGKIQICELGASTGECA